MFCHVSRQDVLQQNTVEVLHGLDLLALLLKLVLPQEVQPTVIFSLLQEDTEVKRQEVTELLLLTRQYSSSTKKDREGENEVLCCLTAEHYSEISGKATKYETFIP